MPTIISNGGALAIHKPTLAEFDFSLNLQEQTVVVNQDSTVATTDGDANILRSTESTTENRFVVEVVQTDLDAVVAITASERGLIEGGYLSRVSDGLCTVFARHPWLARKAEVTFARVGGQVSDTFQSYVSGALAAHIKSGLIVKATGKTSANLPVFSSQNHGASAYVRNADCWLADVNLTAVSPWNSDGGIFYAGVAVSPRHIIFATHYPIAVGATVRFITADNQVVERTLSSVVSLAEAQSLAVDLTVGKLSSDLPGSITPVKVFSANIGGYLPTLSKYYVPAFAFDQEEKAVSKDLYRFQNDGTIYRNWFLNCTESPLSALSEAIIGGDSGNPVFTLVNNQAVLLGCWAGVAGGAAASSAIHMRLDEVNAAMTTLGGGYQLTTIDLSGFNYYG